MAINTDKVINESKSDENKKIKFMKTIYCWYALELPHRGNSNAYQQYMVLSKNTKKCVDFFSNSGTISRMTTRLTVYTEAVSSVIFHHRRSSRESKISSM